MRSLLISGQYYPPQTGGISSMMAAIADALGPARVCCLTGVADPAKSSSRDHVYRRPSAFTGSRVVEGASMAASVLEIFARHRPQALQLATIGDGYLGLLLQRYFGLPYVVYVHGNELAWFAAQRTGWDKPAKTLAQAKKVLAVSRFTATLAAEAGVEDERIEILHPGCDAAFFQPRARDEALRARLLGREHAGPVILTVANLVERKGQDVVIKALARLVRTQRDVTYLIVGDGPFREPLQKLAADLGVERHVVFGGQLPRAQLPDLYALADVFVMPSRHRVDAFDVEGFGLVFLEAGACGKPVIGGRSGGIPDAIEEGASGFLVDPNNADELAERLEWLILNPSRATAMGAYGRQRVLDKFSWNLFAEKVLQVMSQ